MNKKILIILFSLVFITGCSFNKKNDTSNEHIVRANTNDEVIKDNELENFSFKNTSLVYEDNTSTLITTVKNNSNDNSYLEEFKIHVYKDDIELITLTGYVGSFLSPLEEKVIVSSYGEDITSATSITYEIKR